MEREYNIEPYNNDFKRSFEKEEAYLRAKKKLEKITGFYWHLAAYFNEFTTGKEWDDRCGDVFTGW